MTANSTPASPAGSTTSLAPGKVVGGRFVVEQEASQDALGAVLAARDNKTNKPIALRVLSENVVPNEATSKALRTECRAAATLSHRSILATYGVGSDPSGALFVACEWVDGSPLSKLIAQRSEQGKPLSLRGAYNVVAHVCKALTKAHEKTPHGALRPSVVWVSRSGRVKVGDFGVGKAIVTHAGAQVLGPKEQPCLAPEVKAGQAPNEASDIFGIGAILYEMLTQRSAAEGFVPPSQAHPDATEAIDQVLLKCLAPEPSQRYEAPDEIRKALLPLVADAPSVPAEEDFGFEVDVDVDLASQPPSSSEGAAPAAAAPKAPKAPAAASPSPPAAAGGGGAKPAVGARVSIHEQFRPSVDHPEDAPEETEQPQPTSAGAEIDLSQLLQKITENDAPRWMVVKDNLDHGPFSGRELVELILKGEMQEDHRLLNMDTGERKPMKAWPDFTEFLEQYKLKKQQEDEAAALARTEKVEKRSNVFKIVVAASIVGVLAAGGGIFLLTRQAADDDEIADAELADMYESGDIEISGSAGILPEPKPPRGGRRARRGGGGGGGGGGGNLSYREAMNRAVEMDMSNSGGQQQLSSATVAGVMNKHINKLFSCVSAELRRGGSLGKVQVDLAIAGSGKVLGASVNQGSSSFKSCVAAKARQVKFPKFSAPRMGARYSFSVD